MLLALVLVRWSEGGMSRLGACRRAKTDGLWRYAMGLSVDGKTPTEKTVREVEAWLLQEHGASIEAALGARAPQAADCAVVRGPATTRL